MSQMRDILPTENYSLSLCTGESLGKSLVEQILIGHWLDHMSFLNNGRSVMICSMILLNH